MAAPIFGPIFFILFESLIFFVLLNVFIGIICNAFCACLEERGELSFTNEIREFQDTINGMLAKKDPDAELKKQLLAELK